MCIQWPRHQGSIKNEGLGGPEHFPTRVPGPDRARANPVRERCETLRPGACLGSRLGLHRKIPQSELSGHIAARTAARRADRESQGSLDSTTGWLVTAARRPLGGLLPCEDDTVHETLVAPTLYPTGD